LYEATVVKSIESIDTYKYWYPHVFCMMAALSRALLLSTRAAAFSISSIAVQVPTVVHCSSLKLESALISVVYRQL
jgi:hypothetical protein